MGHCKWPSEALDLCSVDLGPQRKEQQFQQRSKESSLWPTLGVVTTPELTPVAEGCCTVIGSRGQVPTLRACTGSSETRKKRRCWYAQEGNARWPLLPPAYPTCYCPHHTCVYLVSALPHLVPLPIPQT